MKQPHDTTYPHRRAPAEPSKLPKWKRYKFTRATEDAAWLAGFQAGYKAGRLGARPGRDAL